MKWLLISAVLVLAGNAQAQDVPWKFNERLTDVEKRIKDLEREIDSLKPVKIKYPYAAPEVTVLPRPFMDQSTIQATTARPAVVRNIGYPVGSRMGDTRTLAGSMGQSGITSAGCAAG